MEKKIEQKLTSGKEGKDLETPAGEGCWSWLLRVVLVPSVIIIVVLVLVCGKPAFAEVPKDEVKPTVIPEIKFRSIPRVLSYEKVKAMLKNHNFFCSKNEWSREHCNPHGSGFDNKFEKKNSSQVVYDHATGLMWQQFGSDGFMTYRKAMDYIRKLNDEQFAGYSDWRLPTLEEAMSLMETTEKDGYLFFDLMYIDQLFDQTQRWIWTSDLYDNTSAWMVTYYYGLCSKFYISDNCYVRAVR